MPQTITNADGSQEEVYSATELAEQAEAKANEIVAAERERFQTEKQTIEATVQEQETALKEAEEKLRKAEDKEANFKSLRDKTKESQEEKDRNAREIENLRKTVSEIQQQPLKVAEQEFIRLNIGENKSEREVFDFWYKKLSVGANTLDDVNKALVAAFNASTAGKRELVDGNSYRTGTSENYSNEPSNQESEASKGFGQMLGIRPESKKEFADVVKTNKISLFSQRTPKDK